jgi:tetratricopeptide (TPR) repeat protein
MPAKDESLKSKQKAKKELDISKLSKVKNRKIARTFRRKEILKDEKIVIDWRKLWICSGIITVATLLLFGTLLFGGTAFNDSINIQIKTLAYPVDTLWLQLISMAQAKPFGEPWVLATYFWDTQSFPGRPGWYHFVNISLHVVSCIYLFLFVFQVLFWFKEDRRIKFDPYIGAFLVALLFMCQPLAAGAVSYLSGRAGLLAGCNLLLALNLFMIGFYATEAIPIVCWYLASISFLAIGVLCSVQAVSFPLLIIGLALLLKPPKEQMKTWLKDRWQDFVIFGLASVVILCTLSSQVPALLDNGVDTNLLSRTDWTMAQASAIVTYFLRYLVLPIGITTNNPTPSALVTPLAILGFGAIIALAVSVRWLKKYPLAAFGALITLGGLVTNFIYVEHEIASDQRFYIPVLGMTLIAANILLEKFSIEKKYLKPAIAIAVVLCGFTIWRESIWLNDLSLWTAAAQWESNDARTLGLLSQAQYMEGKEVAVKTAQRALKIDPKCAPANDTMGLNLISARKYKEAVPFFQIASDTAKAQKTVPEKLSLYEEHLADAAMRAEDWKTARDAASEAVIMRPGLAQLHLELGKAYLAENNASRAFEELKVGALLDPGNPEFLEPTADACLILGSPEYVAYGYTIAKRAAKITQTPHSAMTYIKAALEMGKIPEAKEQLSTFLTHRGSSAEALYLMYWCEKLAHNMEAASKWEKLAKLKDPNIASKVEIKPVDLSKMRENMRRVRDQQGLTTPKDTQKVDVAPAGNAPNAGAPASSTPIAPRKGTAPNGNSSSATVPATNAPAGGVPSSSAAPSAKQPAQSKPAAEESVAKEPAVKEPAAKEPAAK